VWRLDRWGRSVTDLLATLQELERLGVGFVSLTEALDLKTPAGRAMAALLTVFRRVRKRDPAGTRAGRTCSCPAEWQTAWPAHNRCTARQSNPQTAPLRPQQMRDRPALANRTPIRAMET